MAQPILYQLNTRCWLRELSQQQGQALSLATVPESELAQWQRLGFSHLWLMGVWSSGPRARACALAGASQLQAYSQALADWQPEDVAGSPYAIGAYQVPRELGGEQGLQQLRQRLHARGLKLVLDFVPNHLGLDHPWLQSRPELFVQAPARLPETFRQPTAGGPLWLAHGKDPNFAAWSDTVQLDYRRADTRQAMMELLSSVAARCDGVRCDMAMLLLEEVFGRTWAGLPALDGAGSPPPAQGEFWAAAIPAIKAAHPGFLFLAEVYWGLEARLQELGFDYTYDKEFYDRLLAWDGPGVQRHLLDMAPETLAAGAHFLENHDEGRAAAALSLEQHRAAALLLVGLPGMRFLHEGQLSGARRRTPVQLLRRAQEAAQPEVVALYEQLLGSLRSSLVGQGRGQLLRAQPAWAENSTAQNLLVVQWLGPPPDFELVVVNLAAHRSQGRVMLAIPHLGACDWLLQDRLSSERHVRRGAELARNGLYLDLPAHGAQFFKSQPAGAE